MAVKLNHTIVPSQDKKSGAEFLTDILGLDPPGVFGHFVTVELANGVSLDYADADEVQSNHYAFIVSDEEFEEIFDRIQHAGVEYYADPMHRQRGEVNERHGGHGFYFDDPSGHNMEVITRPYGSA